MISCLNGVYVSETLNTDSDGSTGLSLEVKLNNNKSTMESFALPAHNLKESLGEIPFRLSQCAQANRQTQFGGIVSVWMLAANFVGNLNEGECHLGIKNVVSSLFSIVD